MLLESREWCKGCDRSMECKAPGIAWQWDTLSREPREMAPLVVVLGGAPTYHDDWYGVAFSGDAGEILRTDGKGSYYGTIKLNKNACIYRGHVVRCRSNGDVSIGEGKACNEYVKEDLFALGTKFQGRKKAVLLLGKDAAKWGCRAFGLNIGSLKAGLAVQGKVVGDWTLFFTYSPNQLLVDGRAAHQVEDHLRLLDDWLHDQLPEVSEPNLVEAGPPPKQGE
jgi:uracil-DNA glycosylase family 4